MLTRLGTVDAILSHERLVRYIMSHHGYSKRAEQIIELQTEAQPSVSQ